MFERYFRTIALEEAKKFIDCLSPSKELERAINIRNKYFENKK